MPNKLTGLVAATHTPFDLDGSLDLTAVSRQAEHLVAAGVRAVFVGGTTGESSSLTTDERLALTRRWGEVVRATPLRLVAHVGHNCQADAVALAAAAQQAGAHAVSAVAPSYFKPATVADLVGFLAPVAAAAPELPFYFYDIPTMTGLALSMVEFLDRAPTRIPTLAGLKYTNADAVQLQECLRFAHGAFDILFGMDEALLAALALGVEGAVGSSYNFAAPLYLRVISAFQRGDWPTARAEQAWSIRLIRLLGRFGYLAASKHVMALLGVPVGPVRPPLRELNDADRSALERELDAIGFRDVTR